MATMTIRSTYALDIETVRKLERLARQWGVSKSEALRRSIQSAVAANADEVTEKLRALDEYQASMSLSKKQLQEWQKEARMMRRASSASRGR